MALVEDVETGTMFWVDTGDDLDALRTEAKQQAEYYSAEAAEGRADQRAARSAWHQSR